MNTRGRTLDTLNGVKDPRWGATAGWHAVAFLAVLYSGAGPWWVLVMVWIAGSQLTASLALAVRARDDRYKPRAR